MKYLLRFQGLGGWEIRKKSYANPTVFSSMTVLSTDLAFEFLLQSREQKGKTMCPKPREEKNFW